MQAISLLLTGLTGLALTNASPLFARDTCGSAPSGPSGATPLAQPSGKTTPPACQAACEAETGCKSFVCGFVDSAPVCMLFGVPISSVPPQSSPNLLGYDVACTSVPSGTLSASNPTGSNPTSNNPANNNPTSSNPTSNNPTNNNPSGGLQTPHLFARDTCGSAPGGPSGATPLAQPSGKTTPPACKAACEAETGCKSFVCGFVDSAPVCMLFGVPISSVPPQSSPNLLGYDVACTSIPSGTLSASNPTGSNPTGSNPTNEHQVPHLFTRDTCGSAPSGSSGVTPLAQPSGKTTPSACKVACEAETGCKSFVCGFVDSAPVCMLFGVPISSVPPQSNSNLLGYDISCSSIPSGTLSASNPTGGDAPQV